MSCRLRVRRTFFPAQRASFVSSQWMGMGREMKRLSSRSLRSFGFIAGWGVYI